MMNKVIFQIICLLIFGGWISPLLAQTKRTVRIAQDKSYTDHVSLKKDSKDMDLIVKFRFDESNNALIVSLMSYRNLFVFYNDVRYKQVVKNKKLRPDRFPYVVEADAEMKYRLTKELRNQLAKPKKKHVFKNWLEYEGLQPQSAEYKMVNDYIEQKFDILEKDTLVSVSLRDMMVMEPSLSKKKSYDFFHYIDLDRKYEVHIERNPCLGREEEIEAASAMVENVRTSYEALKERYGVMDYMSKETLVVLEEMRTVLLEQFPYKEKTSICPSVRGHWDVYNCYVDSIKQLEQISIAFEKQQAVLQIGAEQILGVARIVDNNVASWLVSTDVVEKTDLVKRCQVLIEGINQYLVEGVEMDEEQAVAVSVFRKAERYFNTTCLQNKKKKK